LTAAVVEAVVNARLLLSAGGLTGPIEDHVVVVGLGNVGTRVIRALHDLGYPVVAVDRREQARGVQVARELRIPLIVGDATREETLRAASVHTCRSLLVLSTDDLNNLEAALLGQAINGDVRVVLRLFDGDFAARVQRAFHVSTSRSVSYLAAPTFAAAMLGRQVIDVIPVDRRVLVVAELPIGARLRLRGAAGVGGEPAAPRAPAGYPDRSGGADAVGAAARPATGPHRPDPGGGDPSGAGLVAGRDPGLRGTRP